MRPMVILDIRQLFNQADREIISTIGSYGITLCELVQQAVNYPYSGFLLLNPFLDDSYFNVRFTNQIIAKDWCVDQDQIKGKVKILMNKAEYIIQKILDLIYTWPSIHNGRNVSRYGNVGIYLIEH